MQSIDTLVEAQVRVHLGCREDAVKLLVQSHKMELGEAELTVKKLERLRGIRLQEIKGVERLFVGLAHYFLLLLTAILVAYALLLSAELFFIPLVNELAERLGNLALVAGIIVFIIVISIGFTYAWAYLFFHAWFLFICRLPGKRRVWAECSLPQRMWIQGFQRMYFSIRLKYLP